MDSQSFLFLILAFLTVYVIFPEATKNLFIMILKRKDYVVCHVYRTATRKPVTIFAVPDVKNEYQTRIWKKKTYNLNPEFGYEDNGRIHFILLEESNAPLKISKVIDLNQRQILYKYQGKIYADISQMKFDPWDNNDILIYADEVDTGINAKSHNVLHGGSTPWPLIIALLAVLIAIITAWYAYNQITELSPLVHVIYEKVQPQNININTTR